MSDRYWVGGTGNWSDDTNHWATTSGGIPGAGNKPTAADNVIFDSLSDATDYTVTVNEAAVCLDFTMAGPLSGKVTWAGSSNMTISGSMNLSGGTAGITRTWSGSVTFNATSTGKTVDPNGVSLLASNTDITFNGVGGGWTLQNAITGSTVGTSLTLTNGSLDTNGKAVTLAVFASGSSNIRTLTLGASVLTFATTSGVAAWNTSDITNLTFNAGTSRIVISGNLSSFEGGGLTFYDVQFTGTSGGTNSISGANTFNNLQKNAGANIAPALNIKANQTVNGTLTLNGNSAINRLMVASDVQGTIRTITAAAVSLSNVDFRDITAAGVAAPFTGTSLGNGGGLTSITTATPVTRYWVGNGGSWNSTTKWSASSGGASGASMPICHDTAIFDANSITSASQTITANVPRIPAIDLSAVANTPTINFNTSVDSIVGFYGNIVFGTIVVTAGSFTLDFTTRGTLTINTSSISWGSTRPMTISAPGGTVQLLSDLINSGTLTLTYGTFDANNFNVTCTTFSTSNSNTRTLTMGTGIWELTGTGTVWNFTTVTGLTLNEGGTIKCTNTSTSAITIAGGGESFNNIWYARGASTGSITITGTNTFANFKDTGTAAHTITFPNVTTTITSWDAIGSSGNLITLARTGASGTFTLSMASGKACSDYLSISNSTATGGAEWHAGANSTNGGGNTGWTFDNCPSSGMPAATLLGIG